MSRNSVMHARNSRAFRSLGAAAAITAMIIASGTQAPAADPEGAAVVGQVASGASRRISMGVGKSIILDLPRDAAEVVVGDPKIANAVVRTPRKLFLMGVKSGQTTLFAIDHEGRQFANYEISIGRDVGELTQLLRTAIPSSNIVVRTIGLSVILTGVVTSAGDAARAMDIARGFAEQAVAAGEPTGKVVNAMTISGADQVMLKVTVAEIERKVLKQLGFSTQVAGETLIQGAWGLFRQENPFAINGNITQSALQIQTGSGTATLRALERNGVSRILAEPTVTAISGENARLLVGGQIPVPSSGDVQLGGAFLTSRPGITFKDYGVTLSFIPVVLSEGRIQLRLNTEVTEVDPQNSFTYADVTVPGFKTRKNETTVELASGASIATAGLLSEKSAQAINGLPGLLNLPILGALFRSRDYLKNETELLVIVTPFIVKGVSSKEIVRPTDGFQEASDPQGWLLGRVNRLYSSRNNPQAAQYFKGRVGFIHD